MEIKEYPAGTTAVYSFDAIESPKAVILLVHGLGEYTGRYNDWASRFNQKRLAVRAFDLPGHGHSGGSRGVIPSMEKVYATLNIIISEINSEHPGVPLFLYGHSLGGGIVLNYLVRHSPVVTGAIVTSPWIYLSETPPKAKVVLAKLMKKIMPGLTQPSGLKTEYLSREPGVAGRYNDDPLVHGLISVGLYSAVTDAGAETVSRAAEIRVPLLLAHGRDDMIISPAGSVRVAEAAPKATLKLWEGGYHELHNDILRHDHFDFIIEWIDTLI
ncbi:MAG: lysophospholipase [Bacteroidales bacterium]|nr:lysophospholipase [Bacteroidales bacterium]MDT8373491.1 alpha/beta hydrolase [Bacteroidales bacterium]